MSAILERVRKLLALAASSNPNEARNAAVLAARLIREHGLEVVERPTRRTPAATRRPTPKERARPSSGSSRRVVDAPTKIKSPLGGDCAHCGRRYRAGTEVHWSDAVGGIHEACLAAWMKAR
jgi:hypothetical protein